MISATMELSVKCYVNTQEGQAVVAGTWDSNLCYIYTMENYLAIRKNEITHRPRGYYDN